MLCRALECSYSELQAMPEDHIAIWRAVLAGEEQAHAEQAARR